MNATEERFDEACAAKGFRVLRSGWPDRIIFNDETGEAAFVEIKREDDSLNENQHFLHKQLRRLFGIRVQIVTVKKSGEVNWPTALPPSSLTSIADEAFDRVRSRTEKGIPILKETFDKFESEWMKKLNSEIEVAHEFQRFAYDMKENYKELKRELLRRANGFDTEFQQQLWDAIHQDVDQDIDS